MAEVPVLETPRLLLRGPRDADRAPLAALHADPVVMEHFPAPLTREQSDAFLDRVAAQWADGGPGLWVVQRRDTGETVGLAGLWPVRWEGPVRWEAPPAARVEVAWRLAAAHWGRGYATEAARAALGFGSGVLGLAEVVSFTAVGNTRSRAVMERLGMRRDPAEDFDHPLVPVGSPLRRHVLYRLRLPGPGAAPGPAI